MGLFHKNMFFAKSIELIERAVELAAVADFPGMNMIEYPRLVGQSTKSEGDTGAGTCRLGVLGLLAVHFVREKRLLQGPKPPLVPVCEDDGFHQGRLSGGLRLERGLERFQQRGKADMRLAAGLDIERQDASAGFASDGHVARFGSVLEMPVTSLLRVEPSDSKMFSTSPTFSGS